MGAGGGSTPTSPRELTLLRHVQTMPKRRCNHTPQVLLREGGALDQEPGGAVFSRRLQSHWLSRGSWQHQEPPQTFLDLLPEIRIPGVRAESWGQNTAWVFKNFHGYL